MISNNTAKFIKSLQIKKYRKKEGLFLVEGGKNVLEVLNSDYEVKNVYGTETFLKANLSELEAKFPGFEVVSDKVLSAIGSFKNNSSALAIVKIPAASLVDVKPEEYALILDDINDPGNLGTIIRIADWYGVHKIICSHTSADVYNPKVVAATMGSFTRVNVAYEDLQVFISKSKLPTIGTFLHGENVHHFNFPKEGLIVIGNESRGISKEVQQTITHKISIPSFGEAESLNAAIATAIVCDNLRRA